jgi:hypothetical protein
MDGTPPTQMAYPGDQATPGQILALARAYAKSAEDLFAETAGKPASSKAPARFLALHSIELFVHAYLRYRGACIGDLRGRGHCFWHDEFATVLELDKKTREHLHALSDQREYLICRYGPDQFDRLSSQSRITATLKAIQEKSARIPFTV